MKKLIKFTINLASSPITFCLPSFFTTILASLAQPTFLQFCHLLIQQQMIINPIVLPYISISSFKEAYSNCNRFSRKTLIFQIMPLQYHYVFNFMFIPCGLFHVQESFVSIKDIMIKFSMTQLLTYTLQARPCPFILILS